MKDIINTIETKLCIDLTKFEKYQIDDLNKIPDEHIKNARTLQNEYEAEYYLSLLVSPDNSRYLRGFVRSVITNRENARTWQKRSVIFVLGASLKDILTKPREILFGFPDSHFKHIIKPDYKYLEMKVSNGGILTYINPDANYKTVAPNGYTMSLLKNTELVEIEQDKIPFYYRRWVASRIAAYLNHFNKLKAEFDPS